jgi:hypothetical protein
MTGHASRWDLPLFKGETFEREHDEQRLKTLQNRVERFMGSGRWHTLSEIQTACGGSEASCSARLRDMRGAGWNVERRARGERARGLFEYRCTRTEER